MNYSAAISTQTVSVLFSEPKIPQSARLAARRMAHPCFSALQRAENSSIRDRDTSSHQVRSFSALQRAENSSIGLAFRAWLVIRRFSALQRAENSSMRHREPNKAKHRRFQCSSASRKFLNVSEKIVIKKYNNVSVLFSEPKIPQFLKPSNSVSGQKVSVLFSEPKIPQSGASIGRVLDDRRFSALQRAENSSMRRPRELRDLAVERFSALQRAENSSMQRKNIVDPYLSKFQCSSASRKFLNPCEIIQ